MRVASPSQSSGSQPSSARTASWAGVSVLARDMPEPLAHRVAGVPRHLARVTHRDHFVRLPTEDESGKTPRREERPAHSTDRDGSRHGATPCRKRGGARHPLHATQRRPEGIPQRVLLDAPERDAARLLEHAGEHEPDDGDAGAPSRPTRPCRAPARGCGAGGRSGMRYRADHFERTRPEEIVKSMPDDGFDQQCKEERDAVRKADVWLWNALWNALSVVMRNGNAER
jgi:hypothetical protein